MVALSFGGVTHQIKCPTGKKLSNFSLKVAKQAVAAMTACSPAVLQHNAKIIQAV